MHQSGMNYNRILGAMILFSLFVIVYVGIKYIVRFAILFLSIVALAITATYAGVIEKSASPDKYDADNEAGYVGFTAQNFGDNFMSDYAMGEEITGEKNKDFAHWLAIFFPAVTDPLAGSNLSGDLAGRKAPGLLVPWYH